MSLITCNWGNQFQTTQPWDQNQIFHQNVSYYKRHKGYKKVFRRPSNIFERVLQF